VDAQPDFKELLALLNDHAVEHIVVGAFALAFHGAPRYTGVSWEEADAGKVPGSYGGVPVFFLGREQYVKNKKAIGRKKDLADLEAIGETSATGWQRRGKGDLEQPVGVCKPDGLTAIVHIGIDTSHIDEPMDQLNPLEVTWNA
jgi:hypothetical protein